MNPHTHDDSPDDGEMTLTDVLGVVTYVKPPSDGSGAEFCRLRPSNIWKKGSWWPVQNAKVAFPDEGLVFWFRPKVATPKGSVWIFRIADQPKYEPKSGKRDRFQVAVDSSPLRPTQCIEPHGISDVNALRRALVSGLVSADCIAGHAFVRIPGENSRWIGPLEVNADPSRPVQCRVVCSTGFAPIRTLSKPNMHDVVIENRLIKVYSAETALPAPEAYFDIQTDAELLRSLLRRVRKWNPAAADALKLTRNLLDTYLNILGAQDFVADAETLRENARSEAARMLVESLELDSQQVHDVVDALSSRQEVKQALEQQLTVEQDKRRVELQTALELELSDLRKQLSDTKAAQEQARLELDRAPKELEAVIRQLTENTVTKLGEHAIARAFLQRANGRDSAKPAASEPQPLLFSTIEDLVDAVRRSSSYMRAHPYMAVVTVALLASSGLVLVGGVSAARTALAVASALAGPNACRVSISPTVFDLNDLLAKPCSPVHHTQASAPELLGDFLSRQTSADAVSVVVLEGCNRAPPENVILELADVIGGYERIVAWRDPQNLLRHAPIGGRSLFIGTLVSGSATFAIPVEIAQGTPMVWTDRTVREGDTVEGALGQKAFAYAAWSRLCGDAASLKVTPPLPGALSETEFARWLSRADAILNDEGTSIAELVAALTIGRAERGAALEVGLRLPPEMRGQFSKAVADGSDELRALIKGPQ